MDSETYKHSRKFQDILIGKTIRFVRYLTEEEAENMGWDSRPLVIYFEDGGFIIPQSDDEGNDGGALYLSGKEDHIIYTL